MKASLKDLAGRSSAPAPLSTPAKAEPDESGRRYRTAQTRADTRQVSGHFKPEVQQTLKLIAVEQDRDIQEILAEALNMVFSRYGKATRAEVTSGRRKKTAAEKENAA
jgi:hypothetical protein